MAKIFGIDTANLFKKKADAAAPGDEKKGAIEKNKFFLKKKHTFKTDIYGGIMEKDCKNLLEKFFTKLRK